MSRRRTVWTRRVSIVSSHVFCLRHHHPRFDMSKLASARTSSTLALQEVFADGDAGISSCRSIWTFIKGSSSCSISCRRSCSICSVSSLSCRSPVQNVLRQPPCLSIECLFFFRCMNKTTIISSTLAVLMVMTEDVQILPD